MKRTIAIGDIHGCYYTLISLLDKMEYNKEDDTLIFLGDYIDRGKNSYEVVNFLINLQKEVGKEKCICLMGNHEDMALSDRQLWDSNGSRPTKASFYKHGEYPSKYNWWFEQLPLLCEAEDMVFCHAGLPQSLIADNTKNDILWNRSWISTSEPNEKIVVFGHTPSAELAYITKNGNVCIDTGCVYGYQLCALVMEKNKFDFVYENKNEKD